METVNQTLRIPADLAQMLDDERGNTPRHTYILDILRNHFSDFEPGLVLGYVNLTAGEARGAECGECGQPMDEVWIGFTAGLSRPDPFGPICTLCATTQ